LVTQTPRALHAGTSTLSYRLRGWHHAQARSGLEQLLVDAIAEDGNSAEAWWTRRSSSSRGRASSESY